MLPETEALVNIWTKEPSNDDEKADRDELLGWYVNDLMSKFHTDTSRWTEDMRRNQLITDTVEIDGVKMDAMPVATEAFGLLVFANCRDKWIKQWDWLRDNPGKCLPKRTGKDGEKFDDNGLWTDKNAGKSDFSGWKPEGLLEFEKIKSNLVKFREEDAKNDKAAQKYARTVVAAKQDAAADIDGNSSKKRGKKRKSPSPSSAPAEKSVLTFDIPAFGA